MTIPDPIGEAVTMLKADPGVADLVGELVFAGGLPQGDSRPVMPKACVVVTPAGGPGRTAYQGWRRTRIDTTCYGASLHESWQVHLAVRDVLESLHRSSSLFWFETTSDGSNALDPTEQWPTCYASYLAMSAVEA